MQPAKSFHPHLRDVSLPNDPFDKLLTAYKPPSFSSSSEERGRSRKSSYDRPYLQDTIRFNPSKEGEYHIRILQPTWEGAENFGYELFTHFRVGPDKRGVYHSRYHHLGDENDPLHQPVKELLAGQEDDFWGADEGDSRVFPTRQFLYWLIDRKNERRGPQFWPASVYFHEELVNQIIDPDTRRVTHIDSPNAGYDIRFAVFYKGKMRQFKDIKNPQTISVEPFLHF